MRGLGALETNKMQDTDCKLGELAILNELAEVGKRLLLGIRDEFDEVEHALHYSTLEIISSLVAKNAAQECQHTSLLARELETQGADGFNNGDLELVCNLRHEARDLLHQAIHASFVSGLEECCDGECSDRAIAIRDEQLNIGIADVDSLRLEGSEVVEDSKGGKLGDGSRGREEQL